VRRHPAGPGEQGKAEDLSFDQFHRFAVTEYVTGDGCICQSPCFLLNVTICSDGGGAGTATIHNGHTAVAPPLIDLAVLQNQWQDFPIRHPIFFGRGLYVDVGDNVLSLTIHYLPVPD